jgi:hypothetical protein
MMGRVCYLVLAVGWVTAAAVAQPAPLPPPGAESWTFGASAAPPAVPPPPMPLDPAAVGPSQQMLQDGATGQAAAGGAKPAGEGDDAGGGNGTNPADTTRRFVLRNEYLELGNGVLVNTTSARFNFPVLGKRGTLGLELPFNYLDPRVPTVGPVGGLGDLKVGLSVNLWSSENKKVTLLGGADFWFPTADNILLDRKLSAAAITFQDIGTGKFRAAPFAGGVYAFSPAFLVAGLYQHEFSFAGDETRRDIHRGFVRLFLMKAWATGVYVLPEAQILIDYQNRGDLDVYLAPEVGFSRKGTTLFAKPGFGINPDPNNRYFGVNFGIRQDF